MYVPPMPAANGANLIRQQLAQGWTEGQIKQYFVQQYGARVLAEPPQTGIKLADLYSAAADYFGRRVHPLPRAEGRGPSLFRAQPLSGRMKMR